MEGEIGRFRRRHLIPVPAVASLAALNQLIAAGDLVDDGRVITGLVTIAAAFAEEQLAMMPLPAEPFDPARLLAARVDGRARVRAAELLLRPGPLCRPPTAGAAVRYRRGGARRAAPGGPARAGGREVRSGLAIDSGAPGAVLPGPGPGRVGGRCRYRGQLQAPGNDPLSERHTAGWSRAPVTPSTSLRLPRRCRRQAVRATSAQLRPPAPTALAM